MFHEVTSSPTTLAGIEDGKPVAVQWLGTGRLRIALDNETTFYLWPDNIQHFLPKSEGLTVSSKERGILVYANA